jgi:cytochrome c5
MKPARAAVFALLVSVVALSVRAGDGLNAAGEQSAVATPAKAATSSAEPVAVPQQAVLNRYCASCHNQRTKTAGLMLDTLDVTRAREHPEVWEKVVRKLRAGLMPPAGLPRPDKATYHGLVGFLEAELDRAAVVTPNPGRTEALHRLNRAEYRCVIRDLLGLDIDVASMLPIDDAGYGFDNIAGVLKINQSQMEQYLAAARKISRTALGRPLPAPTTQEFRTPETLPQYEHVEGLPLGTRGGLLARYTFPHAGEYEIAINLLCRIQGECDGSVGFPDTHELEVAIDGARVQLFTLEPRKEFRPPAERVWRVRVPVQAGPRDVTVAFMKLPSVREADSRMERFLRPNYLTGVVGEPSQMIFMPYVDRVTITGPLGAHGDSVESQAAGAVDTPSRRTILTCRPAKAAEEARCAQRILTPLARRAFRRPVAAADVEPLLAFYREGRADGGFEAGIEAALRRLLVSPEFLFRIERDPANVAPNTNYRVSDLELASRLSFFLWSSVPDDALLDLATRGRLHEPKVLEQQVRRMLADGRSSALVSNFAGQWLELRNLEAVRPDWALFPNFDDGVRVAFRRETELFFESVLREDRGILELLTADYTFVNERLARHYGVPGVYGDRFQRVKHVDPNRRGLLGHGSILLVTSRPNRTSPVLRGKWILTNILGTPPPAPPANVPALQENTSGNHDKIMTVRERMAAHRSNAVCAGCHTMIDPPGFALENFDAVGRWREMDEFFTSIDASGTLPDGTKFDGLASFRSSLLSAPERFVTTVTEKLMIYALGRGVNVGEDMPAIRRIVRETAPDHTLSGVILAITRSVPFQMRRSAPSPHGSSIPASQ